MIERSPSVELSVIVPVGNRHADAAEIYSEYKAGLDRQSLRYEFIFVLDGPQPDFAAALQRLTAEGNDFTVVGLTRSFGEATALMAGFEQASGDTIVTLPAYHQIDGADIHKLISALDNADFAIGHRWPRAGGPFESLRRRAFHGLISWVTKLKFKDLGCGARAISTDSCRFWRTGRASAYARSMSNSLARTGRTESTGRVSTRARCWTFSTSFSSFASRSARCGFSAW